jgi:hypothetical protein
MSDKKKMYTTPIGALKYPYLGGEGRDFKGDKKFFYQTKFVLAPGADADELVRLMAEIEESEIANRVDKSGKRMFPNGHRFAFPLVKIDAENNVEVTFKIPTTFTSSKDGKVYNQKPRAFDAKTQPIASIESLNLGTGTRARIGFTAYSWKNPAGLSGVRLEPRSVQIVAPVAYQGPASTASDFGFGEVDGFEYEGADEAEAPVAGTTGEL